MREIDAGLSAPRRSRSGADTWVGPYGRWRSGADTWVAAYARNFQIVSGNSLRGVHQRQRILNDGHHAEAEQIDLDDAHVGAIVPVPLHDDAARHAGVFERHYRIELSSADD